MISALLSRQVVSRTVESARSQWFSGDKKGAVEELLKIVRRFPRSEPAHALLLEILIEEGCHPKDMEWCASRLQKIRPLRPRERLE